MDGVNSGVAVKNVRDIRPAPPEHSSKLSEQVSVTPNDISVSTTMLVPNNARKPL